MFIFNSYDESGPVSVESRKQKAQADSEGINLNQDSL